MLDTTEKSKGEVADSRNRSEGDPAWETLFIKVPQTDINSLEPPPIYATTITTKHKCASPRREKFKKLRDFKRWLNEARSSAPSPEFSCLGQATPSWRMPPPKLDSLKRPKRNSSFTAAMSNNNSITSSIVDNSNQHFSINNSTSDTTTKKTTTVAVASSTAITTPKKW